MLDQAKKATGADKEIADAVVANMALRADSEGPARRAVVFGGSNIHVFNARRRRRRPSIAMPPRRFIAFIDRTRMVDQDGLGRLEPGQPARLQDRLDEGAARQIKFLDVTTSMLPYGIRSRWSRSRPRS